MRFLHCGSRRRKDFSLILLICGEAVLRGATLFFSHERPIKTFVYICGLSFAFLTSASAQVANPRWNGYLFLGPGTITNAGAKGSATIHIGGGAERFIYKAWV